MTCPFKARGTLPLEPEEPEEEEEEEGVTPQPTEITARAVKSRLPLRNDIGDIFMDLVPGRYSLPLSKIRQWLIIQSEATKSIGFRCFEVIT
jgi:hypothetical protein